MTIKKKLGLGVASAVLGLTLVGGGTYAYFNDTAKINNSFASGTLDLEVGSYQGGKWPIDFNLSNLRPGDSIERTFNLNNKGSLAIGDTYLNFAKVEGSDALLEALTVTYFVNVKGKSESIRSKSMTLKEAIAGDFTGKINEKYLKEIGGKKVLNLTPDGIESQQSNRYRIVISFPETNENQNHLQNKSAKVNFELDARQVMGNNWSNMSGPNGDMPGNSEGTLNKRN